MVGQTCFNFSSFVCNGDGNLLCFKFPTKTDSYDLLLMGVQLNALLSDLTFSFNYSFEKKEPPSLSSSCYQFMFSCFKYEDEE